MCIRDSIRIFLYVFHIWYNDSHVRSNVGRRHLSWSITPLALETDRLLSTQTCKNVTQQWDFGDNSSAQFMIIFKRLQKPSCASPRLPDVSTLLPLKQASQLSVCLVGSGPVLSFQGRSLSFRPSIVWCLRHCLQRYKCLELLNK